jgi:hypothetical protein
VSTDDVDARLEAIRRRAYELSQQPDSGSADENWRRAEQEHDGEISERVSAVDPNSQ